jgi:hypothetical protein
VGNFNTILSHRCKVEGRRIKEQTGKAINVPQRFQELAAGVVEFLGTPSGFSWPRRSGYLNLYFPSGEYASAGGG